MSESVIIENSVNEENKKESNPLSVRVDPQYKEIFDDLINKKGISKKALMEIIISSYAGYEQEKENEKEISFCNEVSLISGLLEEVLHIFSTISRKSQNTVGSLKSSYEKKLADLELKISLLENENISLKEMNNLLESAKKGYDLEKEKLESTIESIKQKSNDTKKEFDSLNKNYTELLEQVNILRKLEKDNFLLNAEIEKYQHDLKSAKLDLQDKGFEIENLKKRLNEANNNIQDIQSKKESEMSELAQKIRQESKISTKSEILQMKLEYNELQIDNIKNLNIINSKTEEINSLKLRIEQLSSELESIKNKKVL